ncbi:MAG: EAL domain-containing protein [Rhodoferax sp.]|nr:EAL domain-containing protein [Rhodoferax sp.]
MNLPPSKPDAEQAAPSATRLVWIYAAFASLWIAFSDHIVAWLFPDLVQLSRISTLKGWLFVAVTSLLLYALMRRQLQHIFEALKSQQAALDLAQRTEAALRNNEHQYRALFQNSMDAILLTSLDGNIMAANPQACALFGCDQQHLQQLVRGDWADLTDPRLPAALAERQRTGHFAGELTFFRSDQSQFPAEVLSQVFQGADGQQMACMVVRDLTELKQAQALLELKALGAEALLNLPAAAESMSERDFMQHGLELAEKLTGSQIAFIHLVHPDQQTIELGAWSKATLTHYCTSAYDAHCPVSRAGIWADALRQRAPVLVNDYASASGKHGLPEGHAHLQRLISVPVMAGGLVRMMAGVGNKPAPYTDTDVETVRLIADAIGHIVQRRHTEQALIESERRLRLLTDNVDDVIWTTDLAGHYTYISPSVEKSRGFTPAEVMQQDLTQSVCPAYVPMVSQSLQDNLAALAAGQAFIAFRGEIEQPCKDGTTVWSEVSTNSLCNAQGELVGIVGITRDITERKAQQQQLQLAAQIFAQAQEGITVTDAAGTIVMVNPSFTRITGYTPAEALGQNPSILHSGRQDGAFYRAMWDALSSIGQWSGEIWNKKKDGTIYPEWLAIVALRDAQNKATHYVANFSDLSQTKATETRIQWLSHFDPLTGLPNRALLCDRTALALSMAQRATEPLTMMLVALDHLGNGNDALGHHVGDQLLVEMARRLSASVREQDTVARLGGKEFLLVLPGTDHLGAAHLATDLLATLAQPCALGQHTLNMTATLGIVQYPDNGDNFEDLFKAVEIAMHRAQDKGRNTYEFFSTELYQHVLARDAMIRALRLAITDQQLNLVYQPQVDLQSGQICGLEALLRWSHPELGQVSPAQFIPLAEQANLIIGIGAWVLQRACQDIRHWLDAGIRIPHVAINASALQFRDNDYVAQVSQALQQSDIDPALIYIEVTESALMDDVPRNEAMLRSLKALGVKLSLDDFGTGYSSLSYLKRFPFDQVKIDQSFVSNIATNPSDMMLAKVIVSIAHGLGMKAIAEGVETETQCDILRTSLCDEIQGYFFSMPISVREIEELFSEARQLPEHLLRLKAPKNTLLLVDDEPNIVSALKRLFRRDGHEILTANSGAEGMKVLSEHRVDIIISDQRMPGMTGVEFLRAAKVLYPDTIRVVLSGYTELQSVTDAINEGAVYRFLTKPWDDDALREQINQAIAHRRVLEDNRQLEIQVHNSNRELMAANRKLQDVLQQLRPDPSAR